MYDCATFHHLIVTLTQSSFMPEAPFCRSCTPGVYYMYDSKRLHTHTSYTRTNIFRQFCASSVFRDMPNSQKNIKKNWHLQATKTSEITALCAVRMTLHFFLEGHIYEPILLNRLQHYLLVYPRGVELLTPYGTPSNVPLPFLRNPYVPIWMYPYPF